MEFLRECAKRLDDGEAAEDVMVDMRERYKTVRCLNVKTSLVRSMCKPCPVFLEQASGDEDLISGRKRPPLGFPPRLPANVRAFCITRKEMKMCKRLGAQSALNKNRTRIKVDGRAILALCRTELDSVLANKKKEGPLFILSIMLLSGRRTCEILNGQSCFTVAGEYSVMFSGQAKRRTNTESSYIIPTLHRAEVIVLALVRLRQWRPPVLSHNEMSDNQATSNKNQSWLSRTVSSHRLLKTAGHPHSLRGLYACMCYRLFTWETDYTEAFVVMHVLGHSGLQESLVYTPFNLGPEFASEPSLGRMSLPERVSQPVEECVHQEPATSPSPTDANTSS